jgi:hypothetical protein
MNAVWELIDCSATLVMPISMLDFIVCTKYMRHGKSNKYQCHYNKKKAMCETFIRLAMHLISPG